MELATLITSAAAIVLSIAVLALCAATLSRLKKTSAKDDRTQTEEAIKAAVKEQTDAINQNTALLLSGYSATVNGHMESYAARLNQTSEQTQKALDDVLAKVQKTLHEQRTEMDLKLENIRASLETSQRQSLESTQKRLGEVREEVAKQLTTLREENNRQLDRMRKVVDDELQENLQTKLNQSFQIISENLAKVYKSMGEMQAMTTDMNDLKRVLSGVKTRGVWGEASLSNLLADILAPEQYTQNFRAAPRTDRSVVEFAVRLPGKNDGENVYLPIDSKFPREDYERLVNCADTGDKEGMEAAAKALEIRIKGEAKDICDKYIKPPRTTDFAILYVPIEGLYAEVIRRDGLTETLRNQYKVLVAGPTTLAALLNSLQMGFTTLAVEKRSKEIWSLLAVVNQQFKQFEKKLDAAERQLGTAAKTLHETGERTRTISQKLSAVKQLDDYMVAADQTDEPPLLADDDDTEGE